MRRRRLRCRAVERLAGAALAACALAWPAAARCRPTSASPTPFPFPLNPDSTLVKIAKASSPGEDQTGVRLMPLGAFSLDTRIQLAQRATNSLDVQYYQFENDATGRLLMMALRDAALRGVRVRLLVDDLYTTHTDPLLRGLAGFPNIEVRLFNPFCCARTSGVAGRYTASIFDFGRLNHRMHNKLFVADGVMAVIGGRNIADEYFQRSTSSNFVDMDAFVMGAAVKELSAIFDRYWNSEVVYPIELIGEPLGDKLKDDAGSSTRSPASLPPAPPVRPADDPTIARLRAAQRGLRRRPGRPAMGQGARLRRPARKAARDDAEDRLRDQCHQRRDDAGLAGEERARHHLAVHDPGRNGVASFQQPGARRKLKVTVVTNSLAATDEPLVHNGYSKYRPAMLDAGVDLYELSPTRPRDKRLGMFGKSLGRLHAKTAVIDRHLVFVGSMNLDPRSASANTELGMFIDSPALAKELLRVINISRLESAYRVRLDSKTHALQWLTMDGDEEVILGVEPESSFWLRVHNMLLGWFVPEQLL